MRILVAGFEHETNTFAPSKAGYDNFLRGEGYPALKQGDAVRELTAVNIALGGFIRAAEAGGHKVVPVIWAGASASAHVTNDAFERIAGEITAAAERECCDAVFLNLHGAMVTERYDDGEGELLARLRRIIGPKMPLMASLDLHANVTARMMAESDGFVAYRTYPHVDMADTGAQVLRLMEARAARSGWVRAFRRLPFLIPINGMCTLVEPARKVYDRLRALEGGEVVSLSFAPGFPAADFPECGPTVWGYGYNQTAVDAAVTELHDLILAEESNWRVDFLAPETAVGEAMQISTEVGRTVVISDTQDNPGAGGDGNTTGMLRALLALDAEEAALGVFYDPCAVEAAQKAGLGAEIDIALGGTSGVVGDAPFEGRFTVEYLNDGKCTFEGPMFHGNKIDLGGVARLRIGGVRIVVSASKAQLFDRVLYRVAGIEPETMRILVNKSSVHFRADFTDMAAAILVAKAPGPMQADPQDLPWKRLSGATRVTPSGITIVSSLDR